MMTLRKNRSGSVKTVYRRTPSGRKGVIFKSEKPKKPVCRLCGAKLGGVKTSRRAAKSERLPSRAFAGELCAGCVSEVVKARVRVRTGAAKLEDYGMRLRDYAKA